LEFGLFLGKSGICGFSGDVCPLDTYEGGPLQPKLDEGEKFVGGFEAKTSSGGVDLISSSLAVLRTSGCGTHEAGVKEVVGL
jgi:hypothetical protein